MSKLMKDYAAMDQAQIKDKLAELRVELMKHNAQVATGTIPKSPGLIRQTKRNIARLLTVLRQKEMEELIKSGKAKEISNHKATSKSKVSQKQKKAKEV